ncbi:MAG: NUDIX domain-containing protein [bacterium]
MQNELWDIYNSTGEFQEKTSRRGEPLEAGDYHLVVHIWVKNAHQEYLIQKRAGELKIMPGLWATTGGSVLAGESSLQGAIRELHEEVGIAAQENEMRKIMRQIRKDSIVDVWCVQKDISIGEIFMQAEEVSEVKWADRSSIMNMVETGIFYDYGSDYFAKVF